MRIKKLIKRFEFSDDNRSRVTLGSNVRLNKETHKLQLKANAAGFYPTSADLFAKTWVANPTSARQWLGFEAIAKHAVVDGAQVTGLGFRLGDGTNEYWHNGTTWVVNVVNWNTEEEVANNIATFPATSRQLQVVINLTTTDSEHTPEVEMVKVLYASDIEFQDDLIYRSLLPLLRSQVRPIADFPMVLTASGATVDLANTYKLETPYNIADIDSVFNHTDDPGHLADLFQSYNPATKVITLTGSVASGKTLWVRFAYEPEVSVTTSQDYSEVEKVPALILEDIELTNSAEVSQDDTVLNRATFAGVKVPGPRQADVEITVRCVTDKGRDQVRLADEMRRFFANNKQLVSKGMDESYMMDMLDDHKAQPVIGQDELHAGQLRFRIAKALFFVKPAVDITAVERFTITGNANVVIE